METRIAHRAIKVLLMTGMVLLLVSPVYVQVNDDPYLWLEEIEAEQSLTWVENRNQNTKQKLAGHPVFEPIRARILDILNADDRIPFPGIMGDYLYNFWQDTENPRGLWRRSAWESYLTGNPAWETVLSIDALAEEEDVNWSYAGAVCLPADYTRCLVRLSRGGADAVEIREFNTITKTFIEDGFYLPEAKQSVDWLDENTLLVASDFGEGTLTTSGYARIAKLWTRGTELSEAETLFEGETNDVLVAVGSYKTADRTYGVVIHRPSFFRGSTYVLMNGDLVHIDLPLDATPTLLGDQLVVRLRSPWEVGGATFPEGALISTNIDAFLSGEREFQIILEPGERSTIRGVTATRSNLLVNLLDNVRAELRRYTFTNGEWDYEKIESPEFGTVSFASTSHTTDRFFFISTGYTHPTTLYIAEEDGTTHRIRSTPDRFNAEGIVVTQREATSKDGTQIPYFVVHREDLVMDGTNPTLLYAYGGFEVSVTPSYNATVGAAWLEGGGVYVVANIRGGGEFGPGWHRSAQRENRQRAFDDFIAVAEELVEANITTPEHLGIQGGSNGGLLVGAAFTQRPDLFGAVVCSVPLLDMRRYHTLLAGASWMAEYGNPDDPDDWAFIKEYSPYQNVREDQPYPRVLFTTTTRDDRVHPGHARKMAAKMEDMGYQVYYFENTEGGHGAGVTNEQRALMTAITFTYLWKELNGIDEET